MSALEQHSLVPPEYGPAASLINGDGNSRVILVCEHASRFIPPSLGQLGLNNSDQSSHAAFDIGADELARQISAILDAPLVISNISRLVYDCNRPPESLDAIPARSEIIDIPGNRDLSSGERKARVEEVYLPFRELLKDVLENRAKGGSALVTIHSFTPVYFGKPRQVELGLLHDADNRLAKAMFQLAPEFTRLKTLLNEPYGQADGVTHTLKEALPLGLLNVMIEVRNDFLTDDDESMNIAAELAALIEKAINSCQENSANRTGQTDQVTTNGAT
ncbi:MAG: N-formylglutamate amidohydrolase [Pseudomonadota bacterium]